MKKAKWLFLCICFVILGAIQLQAQVTSTTHYFPQVADGIQQDGVTYSSLIYVTNFNAASASCTLSFHGLSIGRLAGPSSFSISSYHWYATVTYGDDPIATGYARLNCSQPVYANLIYAVSKDQTTVGMATVFSSPLVGYALLPMIMTAELRYGIAIANDNDTTATVSLLFTTEGTTTGKQIPILPRSQLVGYVDEFLSIPSSGIGTLEIVSQSGEQFSVIGLLCSGPILTTLVPSY